MRSSARGPGSFVEREVVACEHRSANSGRLSVASYRIAAQPASIVAIFVANRDHQDAKPGDLIEPTNHRALHARIVDADGKALHDSQPLPDWPKSQ